jgi:hypothetical protein
MTRTRGNGAVLAVPDGLLIDEISRMRLERTLAAAPDDTLGVVAPTGALPSGSSYRVHAERCALQPRSAVSTTADRTLRGALLVRAGVEVVVTDGDVTLQRGPLLIDRGAHAHDPWADTGEVNDADRAGRPPFPRRPIVLLLATAVVPHGAGWARELVNDLVRADIEGRLALPDAARGLHLTRPCAPSVQTVRALAPDVIVTLDAGARESAPEWCEGDRSTVIVDCTPELVGPAPELVSWQIGRARGRVRARIGPGVDAAMLAALVERLCAGPHPMPPVHRPMQELLPIAASWQPSISDRRPVTVVAGPMHDDERFDALRSHLVASGHRATISDLATSTEDALGADVAVLEPAVPHETARALAAERRRRDRPTIAWIGAGNLVSRPDGTTRPKDVASDLAAECGLAVVASRGARDALQRHGVRAHVLPTLVSRQRLDALRAARRQRDQPLLPRLVWRIDEASPDGERAAIAHAIGELLDRHDRLEVEVVGPGAELAAALSARPRVHVNARSPDEPTACVLQIWSPSSASLDHGEDATVIAEAGLVGVPTSVAADRPVSCFVTGRLVVDRPDDPHAWFEVASELVGDAAARRRGSRDAQRHAELLFGQTAAGTVADRFLGWALFGEPR